MVHLCLKWTMLRVPWSAVLTLPAPRSRVRWTWRHSPTAEMKESERRKTAHHFSWLQTQNTACFLRNAAPKCLRCRLYPLFGTSARRDSVCSRIRSTHTYSLFWPLFIGITMYSFSADPFQRKEQTITSYIYTAASTELYRIQCRLLS